MKRTVIAACAALLLSSPAAWSMGGDDAPAADPTYRAATKLIAQHRFAEAMPLLKQVVAHDLHLVVRDVLELVGRRHVAEREYSTRRGALVLVDDHQSVVVDLDACQVGVE